MKRTLLFFSLLLVCVCCSTAFAQDDFFEGVVRYRHFIEIKDTLANEWEVTALYGEGGDFYINKEGRYRIEPRGTSIEWQIYDPQQARLYFKFIKRDTVYWHAATMPTEEVVEVYSVKKEKDYLIEIDPSLIQIKYDSYNKSYKIRNVLIISYLVIWIYSQLDLFFFNDNEFYIDNVNNTSNLMMVKPPNIQFNLRVPF